MDGRKACGGWIFRVSGEGPTEIHHKRNLGVVHTLQMLLGNSAFLLGRRHLSCIHLHAWNIWRATREKRVMAEFFPSSRMSDQMDDVREARRPGDEPLTVPIIHKRLPVGTPIF